jgi:hypothetical protein
VQQRQVLPMLPLGVDRAGGGLVERREIWLLGLLMQKGGWLSLTPQDVPITRDVPGCRYCGQQMYI